MRSESHSAETCFRQPYSQLGDALPPLCCWGRGRVASVPRGAGSRLGRALDSCSLYHEGAVRPCTSDPPSLSLFSCKVGPPCRVLRRVTVKCRGLRPARSRPPVDGQYFCRSIRPETENRTKPPLLWGFLLQLNLILTNTRTLQINSPHLFGKESKVTSPKLPTHGLAFKPVLYFSKTTFTFSVHICSGRFSGPRIKELCVSVWAGGTQAEMEVRDVFLKRACVSLFSLSTVFVLTALLTPNVWVLFPTPVLWFSGHQPGVLQFGSVLMLLTWGRRQIPRVKGSVPQDCPTSEASHKSRAVTCASDQVATNWGFP